MSWRSSYAHWRVAISLGFVVLERLIPWRRGQPLLRAGLARDVGFLAWNGHLFSLLTAGVNGWLAAQATGLLQGAGLRLGVSPISTAGCSATSTCRSASRSKATPGRCASTASRS